MKILITGRNGFLARELSRRFSKDGHSVIAAGRNELNLKDPEKVDMFFLKEKVDYVIHTAIEGGRRNVTDSYNVVMSNLLMFHNLVVNQDKYKMLFNFCSGAAFNRTYDLDNIEETQIFESFPDDFYGKSKNLIAREIQFRKNIVNLRLFGCFGAYEADHRLVKTAIQRATKNLSIEVHQDKLMDYFSAEDVYRVIKHYIENFNEEMHRDINLCYSDKATLVDLCKKIVSLSKSKSRIKIENKNPGKPYTGSSERLDSLGIKLSGLENSLQEVINESRTNE